MFRTSANVGVNVPARDAAARLRRGRARRRRAASRATCRSRAASSTGVHFAMDYLTQQNRRCEGDGIADERVHHGRGQARRHHRRRRHRRRLPRHRAPPGRRVGAPVRAAAAAARHARRRQPLAAVAEHLPRLVGARRGRRARSTRSRPSASSATTRAACARSQGVQRRCRCNEGGRLTFKPVPGSEFELQADLVLLAMGFVGAGARRACSRSSASS